MNENDHSLLEVMKKVDGGRLYNDRLYEKNHWAHVKLNLLRCLQ